MLERIVDLKSKLLNMPSYIKEFMADSLNENKHFIEDKNAEQLFSGERSDGSAIKPDYTNLTKSIKKIKGQPYDRVTLKDTGEFYHGITAVVGDNELDIIGKDEKTTILEQKYGVNIIGLTDQSIKELENEVLKPDLLDKTKKLLDI